jgi:sortase (surface protein transpeptidase)
MSRTTEHAGRRRILAAAAVVLAAVGAATVTLGMGGTEGPPQPDPAVAETPAATPAATPSPAPAEETAAATPTPAEPTIDFGPILEASAPVGLDIPAIDVHLTSLVPLTVGADGVLPPPEDFATTGWHTRGPTPGQLGPAVIAAHVDGPDGPAVFYELGTLVAGDEVSVPREDGSVATFLVDSVGRYAKADFPTSLVYGNTTGRAEIRLITCGGAFDRATGHYVDNIVVFGHLTG